MHTYTTPKSTSES